jgi:antitoxin component YwqK of YwqJK toxin-antitoxin module
MKLFITLLLSICLFACTQNSVVSNMTKENTSGFEVEDFDNNIELLKKYNDSGVLLESGMLQSGIKNGSWIVYHENGEPKVITPFVNGMRNGMSVEFDKKGRLTKMASFVNDEFHGNYKEYVSYIPIRESNFKNGKLHGLHKEYNERGELFRDMEFKDGVQNGKMNYYNPEGEITTTFEYKNGEKVDGGIVK